MIAFGPVPSRRLGRSLGINNIPPKVCSYSCLYCQVGRTRSLQINRTSFYTPDKLLKEVQKKVSGVQKKGERIDYLSFVPDGEPTLDIHLGEEIARLKRLGVKIAVITNGSLLWQEDVRQELMNADWVSVKVDAVDEKIWRCINRPHRQLKLGDILDGIISFARDFPGILATETMLVKGINDNELHVGAIADFLVGLPAGKMYLSVPVRPPAEKRIELPSEADILKAYEIIRKKNCAVELLMSIEGDNFTITGDVETDLLSIAAVHPLQEPALKVLLSNAGKDWRLIKKLLKEKKLKKIYHNNKLFYLKQIREG